MPASQSNRLPRHGLMAALALALCLPLLPAQVHGGPKTVKKVKKKRTILQFASRLMDEDNKPVSGIFAMSFGLKKPKARRTFWQERHWVAVDNGNYALQLGRARPLPKGFDPKTAVMEVSIRGTGTVLVEALSGASSLQSAAANTPGGKSIVQYAEKTGFAYEAEHTATTARIGAYNAKELNETLDKLKKRKGGVKIGRNHIYLTSSGGVGGKKFEQICPRGMSMVGLRGGSGLYIDNVQVVCAPFE